jgi:glycosyltransferase involved in cell wall biosynthesis
VFKGENILCLAAANWEGMWARAQQFMSIFARPGNRIIYVNPPITYLSPFRNPALRGQAMDCLRPAGKNIHIYNPPVILPFGNMYRAVNRVNQRIISRGLKRACRELEFNPTIVWTYLPNTVDLILPAKAALVYDCADEHTAFPGLINKKTVARMEAELFGRAAASLASASELYRRKKDIAPRLAIIPNGADVEHFSCARQSGITVPEELKDLPRPLVGYIGAVSDWLDQEMLQAAALAHPDWSVVLIGPVDTDAACLKDLPNVRLLGHKAYSELPAYLNCFNVAVIPFKNNELTRGVNPVKLYEYLAAGKPVVSSDLPEVRSFQPLVSIAGEPDQFVKKIEEELAADSPEKAVERLRVAGLNSWEARADAAVDIIGRFRTGSGHAGESNYRG